ncbi:uncharacterized protein C8Q71DRAFT_473266 [Rhodofomes roseus]|uniref:Uncharacterized protein n=1 Tax=Rhodofomes roseus TaxID=34475 RepID=A0ABQ8KNW7_9APHY|nr:uncharacterized protein C8Q71DRAFT_473266 [Rhodofomes roseus]KAH9840001.1 hypothetical protein C8Q71DRAFT_473266 [Rhodofomes roseus]
MLVVSRDVDEETVALPRPPARKVPHELNQRTQLLALRRLDKAHREAWNQIRPLLGSLPAPQLRILTNGRTCIARKLLYVFLSHRSKARPLCYKDQWNTDEVHCHLPHADLHPEFLRLRLHCRERAQCMTRSKALGAKKALHRGRRTSVQAVWEPSTTGFPRRYEKLVAPPPFAATEGYGRHRSLAGRVELRFRGTVPRRKVSSWAPSRYSCLGSIHGDTAHDEASEPSAYASAWRAACQRDVHSVGNVRLETRSPEREESGPLYSRHYAIIR